MRAKKCDTISTLFKFKNGMPLSLLKLFTCYCAILLVMNTVQAKTIRVASFNVSMEAGNYIGINATPKGDELFILLDKGEHQQIRNIAEIIQRVRPDIILLNEFDYHADDGKAIRAFVTNFLAKSQGGAEPIDYPYYFVAPSNTGVSSQIPLDHARNKDNPGNDVYGFGLYPGQYGMVLLSRFPIDTANSRTFQKFLWKDMPGNSIEKIVDEDGQAWYSSKARSALRLSSKSHWDVKIDVLGEPVNILASHPTPPVFDGPENRNGFRNHDEVRFWNDYISGGSDAAYIYDDQHRKGGFNGKRFVVLGDLNASSVEGDALREPIKQLINHSIMGETHLPTSEGGKQHSLDNEYGQYHTAAWRMTADYALPSIAGWTLEDSGVFWPTEKSGLYRLVEDRAASSDHRLVWIDVTLTDK